MPAAAPIMTRLIRADRIVREAVIEVTPDESLRREPRFAAIACDRVNLGSMDTSNETPLD